MRDYLYLLSYCCSRVCLGGCSKLLGQSLSRSFRAWPWHRFEIDHRSRVCGRMFAGVYPRGACRDGADVDRLRYYVGRHRGSCFWRACSRSRLAPHARINRSPTARGVRSGVHLSRATRWLIQKGRVSKAYEFFRVLRPSDLQAARDTYYVHVGVELERKVNKGKNFFTMFRDFVHRPWQPPCHCCFLDYDVHAAMLWRQCHCLL